MSGISDGKRVVVGGFNTSSFPIMPDPLLNNQQLDIKSTSESLLFYYTEQKMYHFEMKNKGDSFGHINVDYCSCGALTLGNYFLSFSYSHSYSNSAGNTSMLKSLFEGVTYLPYSFIVECIVIW